ncbi:transcription antitermination factor NusB [Nocardioides caeni]|uniref:Transcription antitermination protein NusB n=1 Tax=Nocardioides caeni TaxID=574700 RepID=A0A4S8NAJ0_9ACTN|nr:transcription antitermination factor NusB [Nocardioides caeni]THV13327.1 transcription antitermination factor NusB [Nocardioides caeni]
MATGARTKARKRALDVLYAADMRGETGVEALERITAEGSAPSNPYTGVLVHGVTEHRARIDEVLEQFSTDWTLARMPAIDRNVLRIGVWELLWADDVPGTVAVTEAMGLVRELSTDESPTFVNGVLGAIQRSRETLV